MKSILNVFKNDTNYDPNISFDTIVKDWEMNFLGNGKHNESFNYSLEGDTTFENATKNTSNVSNVLKCIFDNQFMNKNNFSCINEDVMCMYNECGIREIKDIKSVNTWTLNRHSDCINKPFFRFILKPNLSENNINHLLYLLADCSLKY